MREWIIKEPAGRATLGRCWRRRHPGVGLDGVQGREPSQRGDPLVRRRVREPKAEVTLLFFLSSRTSLPRFNLLWADVGHCLPRPSRVLAAHSQREWGPMRRDCADTS